MLSSSMLLAKPSAPINRTVVPPARPQRGVGDLAFGSLGQSVYYLIK